jgi:hypothetical protein
MKLTTSLDANGGSFEGILRSEIFGADVGILRVISGHF